MFIQNNSSTVTVEDWELQVRQSQDKDIQDYKELAKKKADLEFKMLAHRNAIQAETDLISKLEDEKNILLSEFEYLKTRIPEDPKDIWPSVIITSSPFKKHSTQIIREIVSAERLFSTSELVNKVLAIMPGGDRDNVRATITYMSKKQLLRPTEKLPFRLTTLGRKFLIEGKGNI